MKLPHIFSYTATFEDGTQIVQNHHDEDGDKSLTKENGTRFTDIQAKEKESKLLCFVCHNENYSFGVDLRDGHFEINGIPFFQHRPELGEPYKDFRVVYFRTIRQIRESGKEDRAEIVCHGIGWQVTHNGENIQKIITF